MAGIFFFSFQYTFLLSMKSLKGTSCKHGDLSSNSYICGLYTFSLGSMWAIHIVPKPMPSTNLILHPQLGQLQGFSFLFVFTLSTFLLYLKFSLHLKKHLWYFISILQHLQTFIADVSSCWIFHQIGEIKFLAHLFTESQWLKKTELHLQILKEPIMWLN